MSRTVARLVAGVFLIFTWPGAAAAADPPVPVPPEVVAQAATLGNGTIDIDPTGRQFVTWNEQSAGSYSLRLVERGAGSGIFSDPVELSTTGNFEPASLSFTPDGGVFAAWGIATTGADVEQTFRPPGGAFAPHAPVPGCRRFVDTAAPPNGGVALTCARRLGTNPPDTISLLTRPDLGPVVSTENLGPPVYDPFLRPRIATGEDGTLAVVVKSRITTTAVPPPNEISRVYLWTRGPGGSTVSTLAEVTAPDEVGTGRPAVTDDGVVAATVSSTGGARLFTRGPGFPPSFSYNVPLASQGASAPVIDGAGTIHLMSADAEPPDRRYWTNRWTVDDGLSGPVPIPLAGTNDPYIPFDGFTVAPDGTEYAVIRADDGVYATSRDPGAGSFRAPRMIGPAPLANPVVTTTPGGDLAVVWTTETAEGQQLLLGGLRRVEQPEPPAAALKVKSKKRIGFRVLARKGVRLKVKARPAMRLRVVLGTSKRNARLRPLRVKVVRRVKNRHVLRIKPRRKRLGKRRNFRLFVDVTGTARTGVKTTAIRKVRVRR